jgi:hypothetical protein
MATMAGSNLARADDRLAVGLASGLTIKAAAEQPGISARTGRHRLEDPDFRRRVSELRRQAVERAAGLLADAAARAVDVLKELLEEDSPGIRLAAARALLENVLRVRETVEIEERLAALETAAAAGKQRRGWQ